MKLDFSYMQNRLNTLPLGIKYTRENCNKCWARKICHLCPANTLISAQTENDIINEFACDFRKKVL